MRFSSTFIHHALQVCSLHPSNDYKTSVLSGLNPSIILEICSRAMSFWQYQVHQEHSFQHAVYRNLNEKNAQLQKQLENVIREANGEINLLNNKVSQLERDLELERRNLASHQDSLRERDKEYQKLKTQYDKIKRKALLAPNVVGGDSAIPLINENPANHTGERSALDEHLNKMRQGMPFGTTLGAVDVGAVVGDMEANSVRHFICSSKISQVTIPCTDTTYSHRQSRHRTIDTARFCLASAETCAATP
ncbi:hypothetical protein AcW2_006780 [Taiwanofungus camphoratus]|nr:hypothetical protein AcW2_006780 [Antrodia cinnamomea]